MYRDAHCPTYRDALCSESIRTVTVILSYRDADPSAWGFSSGY